MIECAVFLAILLPAADVADGCFLFPLGVVFVLVDADPDVGVVGEVAVDVSSFGFICMIFLARLGGGGNSSLTLALPDNVRFLVITGDAGGEGFMAAGGSTKALSISCVTETLSFGVGPVELAGVGGNLTRGMT